MSDLVDDWYKRRFDNKDLTDTDYEKAVYSLKMEKGDDGHLDMEHIFKVFVDENGYAYVFGANRGNGGVIILDVFTNNNIDV